MSVSTITNNVSTPQVVNPNISTVGSDTSSFLGMLWDTVNPLQHIPILSQAYRNYMGETINPVADIAGSTLYGGPIGGAIALASELGHALFNLGSDAKPSAIAQETAAQNLAANNVGTYKINATTQDWLSGGISKSALVA